MALRMRSSGVTPGQLLELGKVFIDAADTTAGFLSSKLLVTTNLTEMVQNVGANENILLDVNLSGPGGLDGRYIKRSPSAENQTILPTTNNVSLTIQEAIGGTSDILDLKSATGVLVLSISSTGATSILPSSNLVPLSLQESAGGTSDILDLRNSSAVKVASVGPNGQTLISTTGGGVTPLTLNAGTIGSPLFTVQSASTTVFQVGDRGTTLIQPSTDLVPLTLTGTSLVASNLFTATGPTGGSLTIGVTGTTIVKSQSGDIIDLKNASSTLVFSVGNAGNTTIQVTNALFDILDLLNLFGAIVASVGPTGATAISVSGDVVPLTITGSLGGGSDLLDIDTATNVFKVANTGAVTSHPSSNVVPLTLQEPSGGSSDILDLKNSAGTMLLTVGPTGATTIHPSSSVVSLILQGGGTDILDLKNSAGTVLLKIGAANTNAINLGTSAALTFNAGAFSYGGSAFTIDNTLQTDTLPQALSVQAEGPAAEGVAFIPTVPGMFMFQPIAQALLPILLEYIDTTAPGGIPAGVGYTILVFDAANALGYGTKALVWGDDATIPGPAFSSGATGNMKFLCASGSQFDLAEFTGGEILPVKKVNETAPGGVNLTKAIVFAVNQPDTSYGIVVTPHANDLIWVTAKAVGGFTLNYAVTGGSECDWMLFR